VHPSNIGFTYGVTETVGSIGVILAAFLAGVFYQFSPPSMYIVSLVLITISVIAIWFFSPAAQASHPAQAEILSAATEDELC
jgi:membrane protein implicated in regulation of membrane protease activity